VVAVFLGWLLASEELNARIILHRDHHRVGHIHQLYAAQGENIHFAACAGGN
jgi:hypothetical protein